MFWPIGEVLPVAGKETDFQKPAAIREKMTGETIHGFDCNYSLLDVEKAHNRDPSLHLCGVSAISIAIQ